MKCPSCGSQGAEVLFTSVSCPNEECQWYDESVLKSIAERALVLDEFIKTLLDVEEEDTDKTPVWHPTLPFID